MKKFLYILVVLSLVFGFTATQTEAKNSVNWANCFSDKQFVDEYWLGFDGKYIRGEAQIPGGWTGYPASITGYVYKGWMYFSISYLAEGGGGVRFYEIDMATMKGRTWGMMDDSFLYENPRAAELVHCRTTTTGPAAGNAKGGSIAPDTAYLVCLQDVNYVTQYILYVDDPFVFGTAYAEGYSGFPAPITGYFRDGKYYFTISYLEDSGLRFYVINDTTWAGKTWGITDGGMPEYYDAPHPTYLVPCELAGGGRGATGAK